MAPGPPWNTCTVSLQSWPPLLAEPRFPVGLRSTDGNDVHAETGFTVASCFHLCEMCSVQFAIFFLGRKTRPLLLLSPFGCGPIFLFLWLVDVTLLTYVPDTGLHDDKSTCHLT